MIGCFGNLVFETNDEKIHTFSELSRTTSVEFVEHNRIGLKPRLEFTNENLEEINFSIALNIEFCSNIEITIDKWRSYCKEGEAHNLIVGDRNISDNKWVITSVSEAWDKVSCDGNLISAKLDISLKEYV